MDPTIRSLVDYIRSHKAHGAGDNQIWLDLLNAEWPYESIQQAFDIVDGKQEQHRPAPPRHEQPATRHDPAPQAAGAYPMYPQAAVPAAAQERREPQHEYPARQPDSASQQNDQPGRQDPRQKYTVRAAIADVFRGVKVNGLTFLGGAVLIIAVSAVLLFLVTFGAGMALGLFSRGSGFQPANLLKPSIPFLLSLYLISFVVGSLISALVATGVSLTLRDGLDGRRGKVVPTIKEALRIFIRVALANALFAIVVAGPMVLISLITLAVTFGLAFGGGSSRGGDITVLVFTLVGFVAALAWVIIALLRYAVVPEVALFEPQHRLRDTLGRSRHLLHKGGQWFLVKAFVLAIIIGLLLVSLSAAVPTDAPTAIHVFIILLNLIVSFVSSGIFYTLYRNRVAVKG